MVAERKYWRFCFYSEILLYLLLFIMSGKVFVSL